MPPIEANYVFNIYLNSMGSFSIYDTYEKEIFDYSCEEPKIKCPNKNFCVDKNEIYQCIDINNECTDNNKPFKCKSRYTGNEECVQSQTDCECPEGYKLCEPMNNCIKNTSDCQYFLKIDCDNSYSFLCYDGICRNSEKNQPNKRRCPIGYVLCSDLSCQKSYDECKEIKCSENMITCLDNTCVTDQSLCPTLITCTNENHVVCPDGKCVENEIYCSKLKECNGDLPYLCSNNECAKDEFSCNKGIVCGHGKSLCEDFICRENCIKQS